MLNCLHRGQKKKKFRKKDDTFFHFLQLGLSMKEALAGGGGGLPAVCGAGKPQAGCGGDPQAPSRASVSHPSWPEGREECGVVGGYQPRSVLPKFKGSHQQPLPLASFKIRNDTQLSKIYLQTEKKRGGG